ncbi:MAG: 1-(5-phosphoribosyl)-5-[(5-phosphoribosylamino)methylideneamino]imidazole-4-carboxamide isomerase [Deltaproteobacteria bacterium]|nr:1-(5-phosphoribosyl)-5-[(5-phosphoribosylamino)methylideneamino]imidazole-4-carboxamide isomerase [Deltaproteobacteria bacterium]
MLFLPAIDLKNGRCVRLIQGRSDQETVYGDDPGAMARGFQQGGAGMLHLVDLDGAFRGRSGNLEAVRAIRAAVDIPLELGGGMRTEQDIAAMLELGLDSVIVGTMAVRDPSGLERALKRFGGDRVQLGIDAREGKVAVQGWEEATTLEALSFALEWKARGITRVIFTDIARDGMLSGPNLTAIRDFARGSGLRITASGGVACPADLKALAALEVHGVDRAIVGKALYEGAVTLADLTDPVFSSSNSIRGLR